MKLLQLALCGVLGLPPMTASAETFDRCTKTETGQIIAAFERAERLALTATTAIGPNPTFNRWFGPHTKKSGEAVRANLKAMVKALRSDRMTAACKNIGQGLCADDTFAFVELATPLTVNLCPNFFTMDTMKQLTPESALFGNGTRAGTIIHEVSHFTEVSGTEDICYSREECAAMAVTHPEDTLINADSYQYFVEDVTFFGLHGANGTNND